MSSKRRKWKVRLMSAAGEGNRKCTGETRGFELRDTPLGADRESEGAN